MLSSDMLKSLPISPGPHTCTCCTYNEMFKKREGGREGGREGERKGRREGGRKYIQNIKHVRVQFTADCEIQGGKKGRREGEGREMVTNKG